MFQYSTHYVWELWRTQHSAGSREIGNEAAPALPLDCSPVRVPTVANGKQLIACPRHAHQMLVALEGMASYGLGAAFWEVRSGKP